MKNYFLLNTLLIMLFLSSCTKDDEPTIIEQGDYPVKEYYFERNPTTNPWGTGINFIHSECTLSETTLDYEYLTDTSTFEFDIKFYTVKVYYTDDNGDIQSEGCPAILLEPETKACQIGAGVTFFEATTSIDEDMLSALESEAVIDYSQYLDEETGFYNSTELDAAHDNCIIGQSFRSGVLEIPEDQTEEEVQPVYLIETADGGYAKFMVKTFKPDSPNDKQTLMMWQVISE